MVFLARTLTIVIALGTTVSSTFAEQMNLTKHAHGSLNSKTLNVMWAPELAKLKTDPYAQYTSTFDATFNDGKQQIVVSVMQSLGTCDNGPNDKDAIEVPPLCAARIGIVENGAVVKTIKVDGVCNPATLPPPEGKSSVDNRTVADFNAEKWTVSFGAIYHGKPWKPAKGVKCGITVNLK